MSANPVMLDTIIYDSNQYFEADLIHWKYC